MDIGRHWARGAPASDDDARADAAAFGLDLPEPEAPELFPVLEENWEALEVFSMCDTQWRRAGMEAQAVGLDYTAVEAVLRMQGVEDTRDCFSRVRLIERGALAQIREDAQAERMSRGNRGH